MFDNGYRNGKPSDADYVLYFEQDRVLLRAGRREETPGTALGEEREEKGDQGKSEGKSPLVAFPTFGQLKKSSLLEEASLCYLFSIDRKPFFLAHCVFPPEAFSREALLAAHGLKLESISVFRKGHPRHMIFAGITAYQLAGWYRDNRFCGRCGGQTEHSQTERALVCPRCGLVIYPKIAPAVIVAVMDGPRLLLSRYAYGAYRRYALLAGYCEVGETVEQTVKREVFEEVGIRVKDLVYYKSQPWSFSGSLLMGFFARVDGDSRLKVDHRELAEAGWFTADEIQIDDSDISLTNEMIRKFMKEH